MKDLEMLKTLCILIEAYKDPPSNTFIYAMLAEMARLVDMNAEHEPPEDVKKAYTYIADRYLYQRHFLLAKEYYAKAGLQLSLEETINRAGGSSIINDPVEYTEKYLNILIELEAKIEAELKGVPQGMGFCFEYWNKKGKILKRDYGIDWDSPVVLNPDTRFD